MVLVAGALAASAASRPAQRPTSAADPFLAAQAAALLPAYIGDLARAAEWDRYTIVATADPATLTVRGTLSVTVTNRSVLSYDRLYFRLYPNHPDFGGRLVVTAARVNGGPAVSGVEQGDTLLWLTLPRALPPGGVARADLRFVAQTPRGASARTFGAFNQEAGLWSLANFYPVLARQFIESGWDRRSIESRGDFTVTNVGLYDVTVEFPAEWTLVSTGVRADTLPGRAAMRRERLVSGPQREFYLGLTRGLEQASAVVDGTRIISHYQPANADAGRQALRFAEQALRTFNARYGPYPLAELDVVQGAMTRFLGMEYPGAVLIEQTLYRDNDRVLETTIAHEIAHQWWYSLVGTDAQGEPWIDEGLASYAQALYYEATGDSVRAAEELEYFRSVYRRLREAKRDAPLATPPGALSGNYVPVAYAKAALFFHALRGQIGEESFGRFLQRYLAEGKYRETAGPDVLRAAEAACQCELDSLYQDWVLSAAPVAIP
ncbi:MAG: M1 family metallopeptidase [Oscillochloridaceae bacterium]|nr:M1 family metallopeptidase [Chloroflexaceae bacterium]MDW8389970.1 M1 family metallopeptidase [Oscillochloridaceae bacterium]